MTLRGRTPVPSHGFHVILSDTQTSSVHAAEIVLRPRIAAIRSFSIPAHSLGVVLLNPCAGFVRQSKPELVALLGLLNRCEKPREG